MQLSDAGGQLASRPPPNPVVSPGWANNDLTGATAPTDADPDWMNAVSAEFMSLLTQTGQSASKTDVAQVLKAILAAATMADVGGVNALAVTPPVALPAAASIIDGTVLTVLPAYTNTGAATLAVSGGSAAPITYPDGSALAAGDLVTGVPVVLMKRTVSTAPVWWRYSRPRGGLLNIQIFSGSGTYTPTPGTRSQLVEMVGAGGAGGGCPVTNAGGNNYAVGTCGGAGTYGKGYFQGLGVETVTIGAGGVAVAGANGGNGGATSFGGMSCPGGAGGTASSAEAQALSGGQGSSSGAATLANVISILGGTGDQSLVISGQCGWGGAGGRSQLGPGGAAATVNLNGLAGSQGGGGGGTASYDASATLTGGDGGAGLVVVYEFS